MGELTVAPPAAPAPLEVLDENAVRRWAFRARSALLVHRDRIDDLNVFPVPDGDTGTNLFLTLHAALESMVDSVSQRASATTVNIADETSALARSTLLTARGNSGVILSQLVRGLADAVSHVDMRGHGIDGPTLARALRSASDRAREAVRDPVEGTILTVADAAASAAEAILATSSALVDVVSRALEAARDSLARTPALLKPLADAGVVDAGGAGFLVILQTLHQVVTGADDSAAESDERGGGDEHDGEQGGGASGRTAGTDLTDDPAIDDPAATGGGVGAGPAAGRGARTRWFRMTFRGGPAYEVLFRLTDCAAHAADNLAGDLERLGDSVVIAGDELERTVHAHVDDTEAALAAARRYGRVSDVRTVSLTAHHDDTCPARFGGARMPAREGARAVGLALVACVAEPGLGAVFEESGAVVVPNLVGARPTPAMLADAARAACAEGATHVALLGNDPDLDLACDAAVRLLADDEISAYVLPTPTSVHGLAAVSVHDVQAEPRTDLLRMTDAAAAVRDGSVVRAARHTRTPAGWCEAGQHIGYVATQAVTVGSDAEAVAMTVLADLIGDDAEVATIVAGSESNALARRVSRRLHREHPGIEVNLLAGHQSARCLLLGVE